MPEAIDKTKPPVPSALPAKPSPKRVRPISPQNPHFPRRLPLRGASLAKYHQACGPARLVGLLCADEELASGAGILLCRRPTQPDTRSCSSRAALAAKEVPSRTMCCIKRSAHCLCYMEH